MRFKCLIIDKISKTIQLHYYYAYLAIWVNNKINMGIIY